MGHILMTAVNAVLPIVLVILLGYVLRCTGFLSESFVKTGNKLVFKVCLPCMLFFNVYNIKSIWELRWDIVLYAFAVVFVVFVLGMASAVLTTKVPERRGVILQCTFRSNFAIIGLPLAGALGGDGAVAVAAVVSAFTIPVFNILAVISLSVFTGRGEKHSVRKILLNIVKNPLIIGVGLGLLCLALRAAQQAVFGETVFLLRRELKFLYTALDHLQSIASPFALLVLGGQFWFSAVKGLLREIAVGTLWRIVITPLLGIGGAVLIGRYTQLLSFGVNEYPALVALFGSPVAVSSAIMAGQMGSDEQLAAQLVVWTSICSIVTIFLTVCILMGMGLINV